MKWSVDTWDPSYGSPLNVDGTDDLADTKTTVDLEIEVMGPEWAPMDPSADVPSPASVLFCDGTLRTDARIWITEDDGQVRPALAASVGAGVVRCAVGTAQVAAIQIGRVLVTASTTASEIPTTWGNYLPKPASSDLDAALVAAVMEAMGRLEVHIAQAHAATAELVIVDGRLKAPGHPPGTVGYIKAHSARYLDGAQHAVVGALVPGQRTPLFRLAQVRSATLSWYLRLPGGVGHPWAGIVRCEVDATLSPDQAAMIADRTCLALPAYASQRHKDSRAPQNLIPVGALEYRLRHALGDARLLERQLRTMASRAEADR